MTASPGGRSKGPQLRSRRTCAPLTQGFFFRGPRISAFQKHSRNSKAESLQWPPASVLTRKADLFSSPPGGGQNSRTLHFGTGGPATQTISRVWRNFFFAAGRSLREA
jgi:hypothetical protein